MKKNLALLLCAGLSLTLFACGGNNSKSSSAANTTSVENNSKTSKGTASQSASSTGNNSSNKINGSETQEAKVQVQRVMALRQGAPIQQGVHLKMIFQE